MDIARVAKSGAFDWVLSEGREAEGPGRAKELVIMD